jgi:hypothetical protein
MAIISGLISLLTGCSWRKEVQPESPGVSAVLSYPVLLVGERVLIVKDDEETLIWTSEASGGLYYAGHAFIDAGGTEYAFVKATAFGRKSVWRDMGTSSYHVYLELKVRGKIRLERAQAMAIRAVATEASVTGRQGKEAAVAKITAAKSFRELIDACRDPWHD